MKITISNENLAESLKLLLNLSDKKNNNVDMDHSSLMKIDPAKNCVIIQSASGARIGLGEVQRDFLSHTGPAEILLLIDLGALQRFIQKLKKSTYFELYFDFNNEQLAISGDRNLSEKLIQPGLFDDEGEEKEQAVYRLDFQSIKPDTLIRKPANDEECRFVYPINSADVLLFERSVKLIWHSTATKSVVNNISLFPKGIALLLKGNDFQVLARAFHAQSDGNVYKEPFRLTINWSSLRLLNHALSVIVSESGSRVMFYHSQIVVCSKLTTFIIFLGEKDRKLTQQRPLAEYAPVVVKTNKLLLALKEIDVAPKKTPLHLRFTGDKVMEISLANDSRYAAHRISLQVDDTGELENKTIEVSRALIFRAAELFSDEDLVMKFQKEGETISVELSSKQSKNTVTLDAVMLAISRST